jgi:hypothetical protein
MYAWLRARFPGWLVNAGYVAWYALLMLMVFYFLDRPAPGIYYLHG